MKSKTSCYEPALARMELRRFAPAFVLYTAALFLLTMNILGIELSPSRICCHTMDYSSLMAFINLIYAAILAQLFFGDLYTTRLSFGLRSLPIPTGGWYGTQVILAFFGSLIPNLLNAALMLLYIREYRIVVFWWLAASQLQFLCFFGLAVLCAVCAGNRIGMVILYTIVNFANIFLAWLISRLYTPLIYGLRNPGLGAPLSPLWSMTNASIFQADLSYVTENTSDGPTAVFETVETIKRLYLTDHVWTLLIWAAVGIFAMWLGLRLLRRAKAESSGDLLAFPRLEPVILLLVTLGIGTAFHIASDIFAFELTYLLLAAGLILGYFGCLMLLKRQVNVFTRKSFLPLLGILAAVFLSLALTGLDVLGLSSRIPDPDQVASVTVDSNHYYLTAAPITDPQQIETAVGIHTQLLQDGNAVLESKPLLYRIFADKQNACLYDEDTGNIILKYTMRDGSTLQREYQMESTSAAAPAVRKLMSRPEVVFQGATVSEPCLMDEDGSFTTFLNSIKFVSLECFCNITNEFVSRREVTIPQREEWEGLLNAIRADCDADAMAQVWFLQPVGPNDYISFYYEVITDQGPGTRCLNLTISHECENTFRWLVDHGYHEVLDD